MAGKKEFDKDYIFNLIMPSAAKTEAEDTQEDDTPFSSVNPAVSPPQPVQQFVSEPEPGTDPISMLKSKLSSRENGSISFPKAKKEYTLVNLTELLVCDRIDDVFAKFNCCRCDKCRKDVTAAALNLLPAEYIVAEPNEIAQMLKEHSSQDISNALVKAILQVRAKPNH